MAAIDKIYATHQEYVSFVEWCRQQAPFMLEYIYYEDWFYKSRGETLTTLVNLPAYLDVFLLFHCDLAFIRDRIFDMYNIPIKYRDDLDKNLIGSWEKNQIIRKILCS